MTRIEGLGKINGIVEHWDMWKGIGYSEGFEIYKDLMNLGKFEKFGRFGRFWECGRNCVIGKN